MTESICVNCQKRIVKRELLNGEYWVHQPAGSAFQDNEYRHCRLKVAEPVAEFPRPIIEESGYM